jgi:hypothetical protein
MLAVLVVLVDVAVSNVEVLPNTVGVPVTAFPEILNPAGSVFAL